MANKIQAKRILQLSAGGLSRTATANMKGFDKHGVIDTLNAVEGLGITYEDVADLPNSEVYAMIFPDRNG